MAYHRYQTEAVILGNVPRGESNRSFFLFTKEFGLIAASAQSVRKISSKLKGNLSDFSYAEIDLIRGGDMWRIVDADAKGPIFPLAEEHILRSFARFSFLLRRLVYGERSEAELFSILVVFRKFLTEETPSPETCKYLEIMMAVKTLHKLGYGGEAKEAQFVSEEPLSPSLLLFVADHRLALVDFVNARIKESHL